MKIAHHDQWSFRFSFYYWRKQQPAKTAKKCVKYYWFYLEFVHFGKYRTNKWVIEQQNQHLIDLNSSVLFVLCISMNLKTLYKIYMVNLSNYFRNWFQYNFLFLFQFFFVTFCLLYKFMNIRIASSSSAMILTFVLLVDKTTEYEYHAIYSSLDVWCKLNRVFIMLLLNLNWRQSRMNAGKSKRFHFQSGAKQNKSHFILSI